MDNLPVPEAKSFSNLQLVFNQTDHELEDLSSDGFANNGSLNHELNNEITSNSINHNSNSTPPTRPKDIPNEISRTYSNTQTSDDIQGFSYSLFASDTDELQDEIWNMNYHEAAIYLEEGGNNFKFDHHPTSRGSLPAYLVVHNHGFYLLDLIASIMLMSLVFIERPAVIKINEGIHASLELLALSVVGIELCMKLRWMGVKPFFRHIRTMVKLVTLSVMIVEAFVVLIRLDAHFRVTRALRPVFLIDNHYCGGIRRVIRQILQSLPPVLDMLVLLFFVMLIYAILGFYLFSSNSNDPYFTDLETSFVSLFVLLTTANFPDVMMPSYANNRLSPLYFITFLIINLYFLMNLLLAVVYETFTRHEKEKFKKLFFHRRSAAEYAFRLLVTQRSPYKIYYPQFRGLMTYYRPRTNDLDSYLIYKALDSNKSGQLTLNEFYQIYEVAGLTWKSKKEEKIFYSEIKIKIFKNMFNAVTSLVQWKHFDILINFLVGASVFWLVIASSRLSYNTILMIQMSKITLFFVICYAIEACLKIIGFGFYKYFSSGWNVYDFLITISSVFGLIGEICGISFAFVFILRSFRLLKLLEYKRRYQDIFHTFMFIMIRRLFFVMVVIMIVYYLFAIIGMECFSHHNLMNCCKNTTVEQYYIEGSENSTLKGYYYMNNFNNIAKSYVTLFELMVVNNWFILMDGYAHVISEYSRLYFMSFYIITMIVITVVVAFILEAFLFRIQYNKEAGDVDAETMVMVDVNLSNEELNMHDKHVHNEVESVTFHGSKTRTKFLFNLKIYANEVEEWLKNEEYEEETLHPTLDRPHLVQPKSEFDIE